MSPRTAPEFRETNRVFEEEVVAKLNFDALDRVYTRDARILPPGAEMIQGREKIKAFWPQAMAALNATAITLRTVELEHLGDTAVEIGRAAVTIPAGRVEMKYVVVWKLEDGLWKWHIDIWNPVT